MLCLLVSIALLASEPPRSEAPHVWIRLERGRAEIVGEGPLSLVDSLGAWRRIDGRGELRLDARGVASLRWSGRASLDVVGPARCQFDCDADGAPRATLTQLASAHVEVRKGAFELDLAGGWRAACSAGVLALDSRGSIGLAVERVVGEPLDFERVGRDPAHARRVVVALGADALLPIDPVVDPRAAAHDARRERAALWPGVVWPWPAEEPWLDVAPTPAPRGPESSTPSRSESPSVVEPAASLPAPSAPCAPTSEPMLGGALEPVLAPASSQVTDAALGETLARRAELLFEHLLALCGRATTAEADSEFVETAPQTLPVVPIRREGELVETRFGARWRE